MEWPAHLSKTLYIVLYCIFHLRRNKAYAYPVFHNIFQHTESPTRPLLPDGTILPYNPQWFEGHPIRQELHGEIAYLPNSIRKFNGFMNIADGSRYLFFLCSKSLK